MSLIGSNLPRQRLRWRVAFVQRKKQLLRDGIVAVILLKDLQALAGIQRPKDYGIGLKMRGDVCDLQMVDAGLQIKRQLLPHDRKLSIFDCAWRFAEMQM